ncbi:MAG: DUF1016 N-terminal domain-containing protein [Thermoguttaceae bacterium]
MGDIRALIEAARQQVAQAVNAGLVALYWHVGRRIREDILHEKRAGYGDEIVSALSAQLTMEYGRGFGRRNLFRMMQFADFFPDEQIVSALSAQLGWSHFVEIIPLDDPLKRDFYVELLPRPPFLPPPAATTRGDRPENWRLPAGRRRPNGVVSSLAE